MYMDDILDKTNECTRMPNGSTEKLDGLYRLAAQRYKEDGRNISLFFLARRLANPDMEKEALALESKKIAKLGFGKEAKAFLGMSMKKLRSRIAGELDDISLANMEEKLFAKIESDIKKSLDAKLNEFKNATDLNALILGHEIIEGFEAYTKVYEAIKKLSEDWPYNNSYEYCYLPYELHIEENVRPKILSIIEHYDSGFKEKVEEKTDFIISKFSESYEELCLDGLKSTVNALSKSAIENNYRDKPENGYGFPVSRLEDMLYGGNIPNTKLHYLSMTIDNLGDMLTKGRIDKAIGLIESLKKQASLRDKGLWSFGRIYNAYSVISVGKQTALDDFGILLRR